MREFPGLSISGCTLRTGSPIYFVEAVHIQLPHETGELIGNVISNASTSYLCPLTLLCLKCEPKMLRLNSPTFETTKLVPSSVQEINREEAGSLIILSLKNRDD